MQQLDARLDQLRHQLSHLPETAELEHLSRSRDEAADAARDLQIRVDDLARAQRKADADVEQVKTRRTRDQQRIDQGLVSNPKDLERMQHELVSLERRISALEDHELEVMEELETTQRELDGLTTQVVELDEKIAGVTKTRDERAGGVQDQLAETTEERRQTAEGMPEDLMTLYAKLREQKGGVGAAALRARRCGGCSLELNAADLAVIAKAPSNEVLRCEECNRILVRTSESGL
ncbi:MAG TPA: C4-type zinc ribbon domain-containing protein [Nocardioidaceae bacterium]|nr:C4-type zinc ribbon domain-containing protein [Nocardioidaceae bacterium]